MKNSNTPQHHVIDQTILDGLNIVMHDMRRQLLQLGNDAQKIDYFFDRIKNHLEALPSLKDDSNAPSRLNFISRTKWQFAINLFDCWSHD